MCVVCAKEREIGEGRRKGGRIGGKKGEGGREGEREGGREGGVRVREDILHT